MFPTLFVIQCLLPVNLQNVLNFVSCQMVNSKHFFFTLKKILHMHSKELVKLYAKWLVLDGGIMKTFIFLHYRFLYLKFWTTVYQIYGEFLKFKTHFGRIFEIQVNFKAKLE